MNEATPQPRREPAAGGDLADRARRAAVGPTAREITIPALVQTLWRGLWLVLAVIVLAVLVAALALKVRSPLYTATMIVAPAQTDLGAASQLASGLEQYANLAALAQTPVKLEMVSDLDRYIQLFGSTTLAARLQAEHGLLQEVFADYWDAERESWRPPQGWLAAAKAAVLGFFGFPAWTEPDPGQLAEWLASQVDIYRLGGAALLRLVIEHADPEFAASVLDRAHRAADDLLREESLGRVGSQIAQVERELAAATTPTRREALEQMLVGQYQAQALLRADQPYAAQVVVPAKASVAPTSPSPLLILALAAVVGAILGIFIVFLRDALRSAVV
ncbi:MAG TPA: Wzz/FepE/Etk N-terminal domain-containing protein [Geminicoccaceae bacterium]|nr:Wzz/FepE/Etk N-terminal domain-containing protein [Geminicoccaceae bacterium]